MRKELVKEFEEFMVDMMANEYADTMEVIREEFEKFDAMVFEELDQSNEGTKAKIEEMIENFTHSMAGMVEKRLHKIIDEKQEVVVNKVTETTMKDGDLLDVLCGAPMLMQIVDNSYKHYSLMCCGYIGTRLSELKELVDLKLNADRCESAEDAEELLLNVLKSLFN